ncbi:hypothetical protein JL100_001470 [Skermanella mucosa]|uniref:hypothetical protein n=1 Tax=Skermanella mucosa TaxID=1789672 RepID=UPI00192C756E|nr:hypothetical protein [Skermanella mucosa]UEM21468.1 hypothetical protein JL100_001470 [Skermanella mucosa]
MIETTSIATIPFLSPSIRRDENAMIRAREIDIYQETVPIVSTARISCRFIRGFVGRGGLD